MRRLLLLLLPVILILVLLFILRNAGAPEVIEVASGDNRVRLVIPKDALIAESDADSIRIVAQDPAAVAPVPGLARPLFAYRLEPEGLRFSRPVQLHVDPSIYGPRQLPMLLHRSSGAVEALRLHTTVSGGRVESVSSELQHFSEILGFLSVISAQITDPGNQHVGGSFFVDATVGARASEVDKLMGDPNGFWTRQRVADPIRLSGGVFTAEGTLTPDRVADRPDAVNLAPADSHTELEWFECTAESTGNRISYTVRTDFKLLLSGSDAPDRVVESPINDDVLTVRSEPFDCLPPLPPPAVEYFVSGPQPIDSGGEDFFETEIKKTPSGSIPVGQDFTLEAEVAHYYEGGATTAIGADWQLKYGRFEYTFITNGAISPRRVVGLPDSATVAAEDAWEGAARFRCMRPGFATIAYNAFVHYRAPAPQTGVIAIPVSGRASVECVADPDATGPIIALPDPGSIGPVNTQSFNGYGGFQIRWWREPADDELYIGSAVTVHVEVQNLRALPQAAPWSLSGRLYTMAGTGLEPRRYEEAPAHATSVNALDTWSRDFQFVCRNADLAVLRHDVSIADPGLAAPLLLSVSDPGLKCLGD